MKKRILLLTAVFTAALSMQALAGELKKDGTGLWYQKDDGSFATGWFLNDDGSWYFFEDSGYAKTGWYEENGKEYYFRPENGRLAVGYATVLDRKLYYFDENGVSRKMGSSYTGWLKDDSNWYYQNADGSLCRNDWQKIDETWYFFDESGYMKTGPLTVDGVQYYLEESGAMATNTTKDIDGTLYVFDGSGAGTVAPKKEEPAAAPAGNPTGTAPAASSGRKLANTTPAVPAETQKTDYQKEADKIADDILSKITNSSMTKRQRAEAIFAWVRKNFRYSGSSATRDWGQEAYQGFRKRHGDCFTYFSVSHELLTRSGIDSVMVVRSTDNHHYWNLVLVEEGWYHFDTCPRAAGGYFCLWTDAQMAAYSQKHGNCFAYNKSLYPKVQ